MATAPEAGRVAARIAAYLGALLLALPGWGVALLVAFIGHAVLVGNLFVVLWHAVLVFAWGVPIAAGLLVALLGCAFFRNGRVAGGLAIGTFDVAALAVVTWGLWPPDLGAIAVFLLPLAGSVALVSWAADFGSIVAGTGAGAPPAPAGVSASGQSPERRR